VSPVVWQVQTCAYVLMNDWFRLVTMTECFDDIPSFDFIGARQQPVTNFRYPREGLECCFTTISTILWRGVEVLTLYPSALYPFFNVLGENPKLVPPTSFPKTTVPVYSVELLD
jgi:hypothetical protein